MNKYQSIVDKIKEEEQPQAQQVEQPVNKYQNIVKDLGYQDHANLKHSLGSAVERDPVRVREAINLSKNIPITSRAAEQNLDRLKLMKKREQYDFSDLIKINPGLSKWLQNPDNAAVAQDEIEPLKVIESGLHKVRLNTREKSLLKQYKESGQAGYYQTKGSIYALATVMGGEDIDFIAEGLSEAYKKQMDLRSKRDPEMQKFEEEMGKETGEASEAFRKAYAGAKEAYQALSPDKAPIDFFKALSKFGEGSIETFKESIDVLVEAVSSPIKTSIVATESLTSSAPAMATGMAGAAVAGPVGLAAGSFIGGVPVEAGASIMEDLVSKYNVDLTNPESIKNALKDPKIKAELTKRGLKKGVTTAAFDAAFSMFAGRKAAKTLKAKAAKASELLKAGEKQAAKEVLTQGKREVVKEAVKDIPQEMVGEFGGEFAGQAVREGDISKAEFGESLYEGVVSGPTGIIDIGQGLYSRTKDMAKLKAIDLADSYKNADQSLEEIGSLQDVVDKLQEIPNTQATEGALADLAAQIEGDEQSNVYFQTDDWDSYWTSRGQSAAIKAYEISDAIGDAYAEAVATGQDLQIPISDYIEKVGKTEDIQGLMDIVKTRADGMTRTQAEKAVNDIPNQLKKLAEQVNQSGLYKYEEQRKEIKDNIKTQLKAANFKDKDADIQAELFINQVVSYADMLGADPLEYFNSLGLTVKRAGQGVVKDDMTIKDIRKNKELRNKQAEQSGLKPLEVTQLQGEARDLAEGYIEDEINNMIAEILASEKGTRVFRKADKGGAPQVSEQPSTFPEYYRNIGAKNRNDFKKIAESKKGVRYDRIREVAIERLINGYENIHSGQVIPSNDFRRLLNLEDFDAQGESDFTLFQNKEEVKDLFVIHNLSEKNLLHAFKMGGLAAPSIAVTKKGKSLKNFGEISLIAKPDLLTSPKTKVFDADVYSPRYPKVTNKVDSKKFDKFFKTVNKELLDVNGGYIWEIQDLIENGNYNDSRTSKALYAAKNNQSFESRNDLDKYIEANRDDFASYEQEVLDQVIKGEYLYNGTDSQGRQKFIPHTLDNVIKLMTKKIRDGEGFNYGVGSIRSTVAKKFRNIKAIQKDRNRVVSNEDFELLKEEINKDFDDLYNLISSGGGKSFFDGRGFGSYDIFSEHLKEVAESNINALDQYYELSDSEKQSVVSFLDKLKNMPTEYFEGKIQRAVNINEFQAAIVPESTSKQTIKFLESDGLQVITYKDENNRQKIIDKYLEKESETVLFQSAYHGTGEKFQNFDFDKISRTAFGWGIYFTTSKTEADMYRVASLKSIYGQLRAEAYKQIGPFKNIKSAFDIGLNSQQLISLANLVESKNESKLKSFVKDQIEILNELKNTTDVSPKKDQYQKGIDSLNKILKSKSRKVLREGEVKEVDVKTESMTFIDLDKNIEEQADIIKEVSKREGLSFITGKALYDSLSEKLGGDRQASEYLANNGIVGAIAEGNKKDRSFIIAYTPDAFEVLNNDENVMFQEGKRGSITFSDDGFRIDLFEKADPSTFLHESGHFFLEHMRKVYGDILNSDIESEQRTKFLEDAQTVMEYLGVESFDDITVEHHELWARSFEKYLMEGKAPTDRLRAAFARFKVWLISVYRNLVNLDADLTDEVRGVMDRIVASQEEIDQGIRENAINSILIKSETGEIDKKKREAYENLLQLFNQEAKDKMATELMKQFIKERDLFLTEEFKKLREQEENKLKDQPVYKAKEILSNGKDLNGKPIKFNLKDLQASFPQEVIDQIPKSYIRKTTGFSPDQIADLVGYESPAQMIAEMLAAPDIKKTAKFNATDMLRKKYDDVFLNDQALEAVAQKFIHSDKRTQLLQMELSILNDMERANLKEGVKKVARRIPTNDEVKAQAEIALGKIQLSKLRPHLYRNAEIKNARLTEEFIQKEEYDKAFEAKQKELLNHELYRKARELREKYEKSLKRYKNLNKADSKLAKSRDMNFIYAARQLMSNYGLAVPSEKAKASMKAMADYDPAVHDTMVGILDSVGVAPKSYKEFTVDEFLEIDDTFNALWDLSKQSKEIEIEGKKMTIEEAVEELDKQMEFMKSKEEKSKVVNSLSEMQKVKNELLQLFAKTRRLEHFVEVMDVKQGYEGAFRKFFFTPASKATDQYYEELGKLQKEILSYANDLKKADPELNKRGKIAAPELGEGAFLDGMKELVGALIHVGNDSSKKKLLVGRGWGDLLEDGSVDTSKWDAFIKRMHHKEGVLKKDHWDFVQKLWDLNERLKPQVQRAHKKVFGYYFEEIKFSPIETPFGTYKGGYAPAKTDYTLVKDAERREEIKKVIEDNPVLTMLPGSGGGGFGKNRVDNYNKPLMLDINLIANHIDEVLRFSILKPVVIDSAKVAVHPKFRALMDDISPYAIDEIIKPALMAADRNSNVDSSPGKVKLVARVVNKIRGNLSKNLFFFHFRNMLEQFANIGPAATKVGYTELFKSSMHYMANREAVREMIMEKSQYMRTKVNNELIENSKRIDELFEDKTKYMTMKEFTDKNAFILQNIQQNFQDDIVWLTAYNAGVAAKMSEEAIINMADSIIRTTQNANRPLDVSQLQRNEVLNALQMFMGWFNNMANLNITNFQKLYYSDLNMREKTGRALYLYMSGYAILGIMSASLKKLAAGDLDEDKDNMYIDDLYDIFIASQYELALGMMPGIGPAIQTGINQVNDKFYDDKVGASPVLEAIAGMTGTGVKLVSYPFVEKPNLKGRDILMTVGIATGLPVYVLKRPYDFHEAFIKK